MSRVGQVAEPNQAQHYRSRTANAFYCALLHKGQGFGQRGRQECKGFARIEAQLACPPQAGCQEEMTARRTAVGVERETAERCPFVGLKAGFFAQFAFGAFEWPFARRVEAAGRQFNRLVAQPGLYC